MTTSEGVKYPGDVIKIIKGWESILQRPGMYMGKKSIFGLQCFVHGIQLADGFRCGARDDDKVFEMKGDDWFNFEQWVRKKSKKKAQNIRSFDFALMDAGNDDEKAFDVWAEWFKEWKKETQVPTPEKR
jgi:hypothetical protein